MKKGRGVTRCGRRSYKKTRLNGYGGKEEVYGFFGLHYHRRNDLIPLCPYCGASLNEVYIREKGLGYITARNSVFFCPHCLKALGFGQSRMM